MKRLGERSAVAEWSTIASLSTAVEDPLFAPTRAAIEARQPITIDVLYGDFDGGQRVIGRFTLRPASSEHWLVSSSRHWNLDRPEPR